jgi:membrane-bound serine protease (ClpP class)
MNLQGVIMNILLDPNIAYLLLLVGFLLGLLALVTPGTGLLEIGAFICLGLAGYAVLQLGFNWWALILLALSIPPFIFAIRKPKRELYLAFSILLLVIGSAYLFPGGSWKPAVNLFVAGLGSLLFAGFLWIAIRKILRALHASPTSELNSLIGLVGMSKAHVHQEGSVQVAGELWSAHSTEPISAGSQIRVVRREGFSLVVEKENSTKSK